MHILRLLQGKAPRIVVLENVGGLRSAKHRDFFEAVLSLLREMRWRWLPGQKYIVDWRLLDTKYFNIPQSRPRVWIVAVRADSLQHALEWPRPRATPCDSIDALLGPRPSLHVLAKALPPPTSANSRLNVERGLITVRSRGFDPFRDTHVMEVDNSQAFGGTIMRGCSPCLTRARARAGGHWVTTRGRRLSTAEMLKLQFMQPERLHVPEGVPLSEFHAMIGNSMSVNIVEALLSMLGRACPDVLKTGPLPDPWSAPL